MKSIVLFCLVAMAAAAPAGSSGDAQILKFENSANTGSGDYHYAHESSDGIKGEATGEFHPGSGKEDEGFVAVRGSFEYVGNDGVTYTVTYVADENGYHPTLVQGPGGAISNEVLKYFSVKK